MQSELDRIFDDHKKRNDAIIDKFAASVRADIDVWSKQVARKIVTALAVALIFITGLAVMLALGGASIDWPWK